MTQITGPGGPVMSGGENEPHQEPPTIDGVPPTMRYAVVAGDEAGGDNGLLNVVYQGDSLEAATAAYDEADPGDGFVQLLDGGEAVEAKRRPDTVLADTGPAAEPAAGRQAKAFDDTPFKGDRPMIDDEEADKIRVAFAGTWELDPAVADDVAFFNRLALGKSLDLQVEVEVADKTARYKRSPETDEETVTGIAKVKVVHARRLTPEQL